MNVRKIVPLLVPFLALHAQDTRSAATIARDRHDSAEVARLEREIIRASNARDAVSLSTIIADDYWRVGRRGAPLGKPTVVEHWTSAHNPLVSLADVQVRVRGESAVAYYVEESRDSAGATGSVTQGLDVWARQRGRWRLVADLGAPLPVDTVRAAAEILSTWHALGRAWNRDTAALARLMTDDFLTIAASSGQSYDRRAFLARRMARAAGQSAAPDDPSRPDSASSIATEQRIRWLGEVGILTYKVSDSLFQHGRLVEAPTTRTTDLFVRRDGRWRWAGGHESLVPPTTRRAGEETLTLYARTAARLQRDSTLRGHRRARPAETDALAWLIGRWTIAGRAYRTPTTPEQTFTGSASIAPGIDGQWLVSEETLGRLHTRVHFGYDPAAQRWVVVYLDTSGLAGRMAALGPWDGTRLVLTGTIPILGEPVELRETIAREGTDAFVVSFEEHQPDGRWIAVDEYRYARVAER